MQPVDQYLIRYSLAFMWIFTALTSLFWGRASGIEILEAADITGLSAELLIDSGSLLDLFIGLWLLSDKAQKTCCNWQLVTITTFTVLLSLISPEYWLHPFGPITKNIPIIVLILIYRRFLQSAPANLTVDNYQGS